MNTTETWGHHLTAEQITKRSVDIAANRAECEARVDMTPRTFLKRNPSALPVASVLCTSTALLALLKGHKWTKYWLALCVAIGLYLVRAKPFLNDNPKLGKFLLPIIGDLPLVLYASTTSISCLILEMARRIDFATCQISMPTMRVVFIQDERDRLHVLKTNWQNYTKNLQGDQSGIDEVFYELLGRGIFAVDGEEWRDHRKIASHMFSLASLQGKMETVMRAHANQFACVLKSTSGCAFDLQEWFQCTTFDTLCEICFGESPGGLEESAKGHKPRFLTAFDTAQCLSALRSSQIPVVWKTMRMFNLGAERKVTESIKIVHDHLQDVVDRTKKYGGENADLLSLYVRFSKTLGLDYIAEDAYLKDVALSFILAGRDTTACTLVNWIKLVSTHPEVEQRLVKEFDDVLQGREPTAELLSRCNYADAVFNEVLRMYPPVPVDFRICNESDTWPSGTRVERGDKCAIANIAIGRNPKHWANPDDFIPERWLPKSGDGDGRVKRPDEYLFPVFWGGKRLCLGKDMARLEVKMFTAVLHKQFAFHVAPHREMYVNGPVMFYQDPLECTVTEKKAPL